MPEPVGDSAQAVIDAAHLAHQREWSLATFGPGSRLKGVLDHIRKELKEIEDDPSDVSEWVDVIILAFDGAWRAGWEPQQIIDGIKAKQARNERRQWPDWRTMSEDEAIEHVRLCQVQCPTRFGPMGCGTPLPCDVHPAGVNEDDGRLAGWLAGVIEEHGAALSGSQEQDR